MAAAAAVMLVAPGAEAQSTAPPPGPTVEQWREDLEHYAREMEAVHEDLYHTVSREAFRSALGELEGRLPELARHEVIVELARITSMIGDGHTSLWLTPNQANGFRQVPILLYWFADGLYVLAAPNEHARAVGGRVVEIGGVSAEEALNRVRPLVPRDNEMTVLSIAPRYLEIPEVLHALRITDSTDRVRYVVRTQAGARVAVQLDAIPDTWLSNLSNRPFLLTTPADRVELVFAREASAPDPPWLSDPGRPFWYRYLEAGTLYAQINAIANQSDGTLERFTGRVLAEVDSGRAQRLILDLRLNGGGNNFLNWPLVRGIAMRPAIDERGKLFVLVGRHTFSAASHLVTYLERFTHAIFVGEPTGGSPNHYGDARPVRLPNSGLQAHASTIYWQNSQPKEFDARPWTPPEIAVDMTMEDYRQGRDPALQAAVTWRPDETLAQQVLQGLTGGPQAGEAAFRAYRDDPRHRYLNSEAEMNALGYRLLDESRTGDAILVFRWNAEAYPESANVWDSLGDGYRAEGRIEEAIESYRRALAVDPDFLPSRRNLEELTSAAGAH